MKQVLIIGGCGYIGSSLYLYLTSKNYHITTVDLELFGNEINPKNIKKNYSDLSKDFFKKFDIIILLAGHSSVQMCLNNRKDSFENNVQNFIDLLEKIDDQKFIYASSSSVYGNSKSKVVDETYDRYTPSNYYDLTKKVIDYYAQLSGSNYFGLRFGTVNGYSPNFRSDLMINKMFLHAKEKKNITLYNANVHRPLLGIYDLCRAVEAIIKQDKTPGLYNLASFNKTIKEIGQTVGKYLHTPVSITSDKDHNAYDFSIDTRKFQQEFNFVFNETVETIVKSIENNYKKLHPSVRI